MHSYSRNVHFRLNLLTEERMSPRMQEFCRHYLRHLGYISENLILRPMKKSNKHKNLNIGACIPTFTVLKLKSIESEKKKNALFWTTFFN